MDINQILNDLNLPLPGNNLTTPVGAGGGGTVNLTQDKTLNGGPSFSLIELQQNAVNQGAGGGTNAGVNNVVDGKTNTLKPFDRVMVNLENTPAASTITNNNTPGFDPVNLLIFGMIALVALLFILKLIN